MIKIARCPPEILAHYLLWKKGHLLRHKHHSHPPFSWLLSHWNTDPGQHVCSAQGCGDCSWGGRRRNRKHISAGRFLSEINTLNTEWKKWYFDQPYSLNSDWIEQIPPFFPSSSHFAVPFMAHEPSLRFPFVSTPAFPSAARKYFTLRGIFTTQISSSGTALLLYPGWFCALRARCRQSHGAALVPWSHVLSCSAPTPHLPAHNQPIPHPPSLSSTSYSVLNKQGDPATWVLLWATGSAGFFIIINDEILGLGC